MAYFSLQGEVWASERDSSGNPTNLVFMGNVPEFELSLEIEKTEHIESFTGERAIDATLVKAKKGSISLSVEELTDDNIKLALYGVKTTVAGSTVTNEALPVAVDGATLLLAHQKVSSVVLKDSTPTTPVTLVEGTDYEVDLTFGSVKILDIDGLLQPIKASYSYAAGSVVSLLGANMPERWIRFKGINTADGSNVLIDLYKVSFDPTSGFSLMSEGYNKMPLKGNLMADTTKKTDAVLGMFGRYVELG